MNRYQVSNGEQVGHNCCYGAVVLDTTKPHIIGGKQYKDHFDVICECRDTETAMMIVNALNSMESMSDDDRGAITG